jgi:hypothetical protein
VAVTVGNISSASGNVTTLSWSHTTAAGSNKELRVCVSLALNESVSSVTWDVGGTPISGTLIRAEQNAGSVRAEIWQINDPPASTTANIDVVGVSKARMIAGAVDFSGADVDSGVDDVGSSGDAQTSVSNSPTNVVADDFVVDALAMDANQGATTGANQTDIYNTGFHVTIGGAASHQDGTDGAAMSWTFTSTDIAHAAVRVPAAVADATSEEWIATESKGQQQPVFKKPEVVGYTTSWKRAA